MDGADDMLWNCSEEDRNVRSERMEDESNDCEDGERNTDWKRQMESDFFLCKKCMKLTVNYYFLADILFLGVVLDLNKHFSLADVFYVGGHLADVFYVGGHLADVFYVSGRLRLESSCIRANKETTNLNQKNLYCTFVIPYLLQQRDILTILLT